MVVIIFLLFPKPVIKNLTKQSYLRTIVGAVQFSSLASLNDK